MGLLFRPGGPRGLGCGGLGRGAKKGEGRPEALHRGSLCLFG